MYCKYYNNHYPFQYIKYKYPNFHFLNESKDNKQYTQCKFIFVYLCFC